MKRIISLLILCIAICAATLNAAAAPFEPVAGQTYQFFNTTAEAFFSTTPVTVDGSLKAFSFQKEAAPLTITVVEGGTATVPAVTIQLADGRYVGASTANTWDVIASAEPYTWTIKEVKTNSNTYYIYDTANQQLGNSGNAKLGNGIFRGKSSSHNVWAIQPYVAVEPIRYEVSVTGLDEAAGGLVYNGQQYLGGSIISSVDELTTGLVSPIFVAGHQASVSLADLRFTVAYRENRVEQNPAAITALLDRIDTSHTLSKRIITRLDENLFTADGHEQFTICGTTISGSSPVAIATGVNWFLNHRLHVNLAWNQLAADFSQIDFPDTWTAEIETHTCDADYRYYLNYCTFGYSMTTWTWERWQQEIDWMALHGINMPLQIIGLEEVWRRTLRAYNYTDAEAKAFAAGPAFTAWWGMNNLEGWGGTQDDAWFDRQADLARKIGDRMRQLGMQPVLPGFASTVPHDFTKKNPAYATESQGNWGSTFVRPFIMDPTSAKFQEVAATYYKALAEVMGTSKYYSMDPFHEGGAISSGKYAEGYRAIYDAMNDCCGSDTRWVIQQWQWAGYQGTSLTAVPAGRLVVLDLFSDGNPAFDRYAGYAPQHAVYCTIPNFGGRTGFMGRLPKMADNYFTYKKKYPTTVHGIGAAPEAIEQTPVAYDLLFELPWMNGQQPDTKAWMEDYVSARYSLEAGASVPDGSSSGTTPAYDAWEKLRATALNNTTTLQGPHEAVMCGRPSLTVDKVSAWGGSDIFYDTQKFLAATYDLLNAAEAIGTSGSVGANNMSYDLCDIVRQAMSDYSKSLLASVKSANDKKNTELFAQRRDKFLQLILDTDRLLGTNRMFRLGNWTETARRAAAEIQGATTATPDWYELDNARTLITTWGDKGASDWGLRDYSYRQWQGLLSDYYYPRWRYWFDHDMKAPTAGWFYSEWNWAHELQNPAAPDAAAQSIDQWGAAKKGTELKAERTYYSPDPVGSTLNIACEILNSYILPITLSNNTTFYAYRGLDHALTAKLTIAVESEATEIAQPFDVATTDIATFAIDFNNDGDYDDPGELLDAASLASSPSPLTSAALVIPDDAKWGTKVKAQLTLTDGTIITYRYSLPIPPDALRRASVDPSVVTIYDLQGRRVPANCQKDTTTSSPRVFIEGRRRILHH
ncbi:MAG: alpha-N-acetylglucosaminidase [Bacteroidales bacterium]|nr:alpha-N-acetylglucosaminidase [Bacteroidales bacterium]